MGEGASGILSVKLAGIARDENMKKKGETAAVIYNWSHTNLSECNESPWPLSLTLGGEKVEQLIGMYASSSAQEVRITRDIRTIWRHF